MVTKNMMEEVQSFLNVLHLLTDGQVRTQHCILCCELEAAGYTADSWTARVVNNEVKHRLYPQPAK